MNFKMLLIYDFSLKLVDLRPLDLGRPSAMKNIYLKIIGL